MKWSLRSRVLRSFLSSLLGLLIAGPFVSAQEKAVVPAGGSVNITVTAVAPAPPVSITLLERHGHVTPHKGNCDHTGGGLIDVASPTPDVIIITMSGSVIGAPSADMHFDLDQCFDVSIDDPKVKKAKISVEGRVVGLLRGGSHGCAQYDEACAHLSACSAQVLSVCVPPHSACDCESLSVNDHDGPKYVPVTPGKYTLHQTFLISAKGCWLLKHPSAEFAPDPSLDPLWLSYWEPFHGVKKETFGFQVTIKVAPDTDEPTAEKKEPEKLGAPLPEKK
jgi:hypothetical protein